jgi:predicted DNA-binding protein (MmcQ/YjbR family)
MKLEKLKKHLMAHPGANEGTAWGPEHLVYKVGGKLFAVVGWDNDPMTMSLKCDPNEIEEMRKVFDAVRPAPYFNKRHWNQIILDGSVPEPELLAMINESYRLVVQGLTKKQRDALGAL